MKDSLKIYPEYKVIGPTILPLHLSNGQIADFVQEGFVFELGKRYSALRYGNITGEKKLLARISSNCQWAFYFDSQLCDCRWQLEESKRRIVEEGKGLLIFAHDQNGKGVSLEDHWLIYSEGQRRGLELVVDAYESLGFKEDYREYEDIITILRHYEIETIRLLTNNPHRKEFLVDKGILVAIESLEEPLHPHLKSEYHAKKHKLGHWLRLGEE